MSVPVRVLRRVCRARSPARPPPLADAGPTSETAASSLGHGRASANLQARPARDIGHCLRVNTASGSPLPEIPAALHARPVDQAELFGRALPDHLYGFAG